MGESSAGAMSKMVRQPVSPGAGHAPAGAGAGDEHAAGELRVGIELQRVLDHVGVLAGGTRGASADDRAAVGNAGVIAVELFLRNEGDRGVVVGEVVRHRDDGLFDGGRIGALLGHDEALAGVFLARGQLRVGTGAHGLQRLGHGHRVLAGVHHAGMRRMASECPWETPRPQKV